MLAHDIKPHGLTLSQAIKKAKELKFDEYADNTNDRLDKLPKGMGKMVLDENFKKPEEEFGDG